MKNYTLKTISKDLPDCTGCIFKKSLSIACVHPAKTSKNYLDHCGWNRDESNNYIYVFSLNFIFKQL